jgi:hypothetical protein
MQKIRSNRLRISEHAYMSQADAPLEAFDVAFTNGGGEVRRFTSSSAKPPFTEECQILNEHPSLRLW